ncbi:MAG: MFS transporter [Actinomycetota bacterium]|nr:MFS transporter [Actinomycetota bacterium]
MTVASTPALKTTSIRSAEFRAMIGMVLFIMLGFGLIIPALPLFVKKFSVGASGVGILLSAFAVMRLIGDMIAGSLIDRFGERAMAAIGAAIVGISSASAGAAPSYWWLVALRGVGGIGSAFFLGAVTAYLIGSIDPVERGRAVGVFQGAVGIGITLGPAVGGVLQSISVRLPLYVYGIVAIATAPVCLVVLGRRKILATTLDEAAGTLQECPPASRPPALSLLRPLLKDSAYRAALVASASDFWISSALFTLVSLVWVDRLGLSKGTSGVPLTALGLAAIAVIWHAGSVSDRRGRKFTLVPALGASAVTLVLLGFVQNTWQFMVLMIVLGVASAYSRPGSTSIVADVTTQEQRAMGVSGYRTSADIGALASPVIAGVIAQTYGFRAAFLAIAGFVFIAFAFALRARETLPTRAVEPDSIRVG